MTSLAASASRVVRLGVALLATFTFAALIAGCGASVGPTTVGQETPDASGTGLDQAEQMMPAAPLTNDAWLRAVAESFAHGVRGMSAAAWLAQRATHTRPGERLAVVLGVDDVVVPTHFAGLTTLVTPTVEFVRTARKLPG